MSWISENWIVLVLLGAVVFYLMRRPGRTRSEQGVGHGRRNVATLDATTGEPIEPDEALSLTHAGRSYYFANAANRDRFNTDPEKFAKAADAKARHDHGGGHGCC